MALKFKILCLFVCMSAPSFCQRSPYVPRPVDYPGVLSKYNTTPGGVSTDLDNRFGAIPSSQPGGIYGEDLVNRVSTWPKEKQPFWFLNSFQLANHNGYPQQQQGEDTRGSRQSVRTKRYGINGRDTQGSRQSSRDERLRDLDRDIQGSRQSSRDERLRDLDRDIQGSRQSSRDERQRDLDRDIQRSRQSSRDERQRELDRDIQSERQFRREERQRERATREQELQRRDEGNRRLYKREVLKPHLP